MQRLYHVTDFAQAARGTFVGRSWVLRDGKVTGFAWEMIAPAERIVGSGCWVTRGARTDFVGVRCELLGRLPGLG